ncbi:hypothetical protein E2I00_009935 [Balaenoptera physalus]|uniref:protein-serine/threonine phosphatase n=1 Tax=Balaenoptera physalus TaxID=9770 RepID=A0A643CEN0_BALPH|nr:hypothetical protein E2I00_009935 [Balaenoptera physalus]
MAALARLLECLLWPARKQEWVEEAEKRRSSPDGPQSLLDAPRCAQRPHGGAAASWGLRFGASAVQGWRAHMEDAHCAWLELPGLGPGWAFFAVLDGHEAPGRPPELQLVSAEPEVTALARRAEDEFMLLASDGVWDAMSGSALAGLVASRLCLGLAPELLCAQLLDTCLCKGSLDNMTCILVCFPGAPRPCEEAIRKELVLDAALGRRVAELCAFGQEPPSLNTVFRTLASEDIPDLPPGGGLHCKATVIADAYSQWGRMGLRSPLAPIQALPWTWRPDSCHPLGTLCPAGASMELRKKTPLPQLCRLAEGRETNGGTPECLFPFLLLPSHKTESLMREGKFHPPARPKKKENQK